MSLLIRGGRILSGAPPALTRADVLVDGDRIAAVGPALTAPEGAGVIDAGLHIVLPGLANAHTHAGSHLVRGRAGQLDARGSADPYRRRTTGSARRRTSTCRRPSAPSRCSRPAAPRPTTSSWPCPPSPTRRSRRWPARTATSGRASSWPRRSPTSSSTRPCRDCSICCRRICDEPSRPSQPAPTKGLLDLTARLIKRWHGTAEGRVRVAASPTIPNQATDELLDGFVRLAREHGVGIHTHLAESKVQVIESRRRHGRSIVARLAEPRACSVRASSAPTGSGSATTTSACSPMPAPPSPTTRGAISGSAAASRPCASCSTAAWRWGWARTARCAPTTRTSSKRCASPRSSARSASRTRRVAGSTPPPCGRWRRRAAPACSDSPETWARSRREAGGPRPAARGLGLPAAARRSGQRARLRRDRRRRGHRAGRRPRGRGAGPRHHGGREPHLRPRAGSGGPARAQSAEAWALAGELAPYVAAACRAAVATPLDFNRYAAPIPTRA